jgi:hypothetical protein
MPRIGKGRIARGAPIYSSNIDAGRPLGVHPANFGPLCCRFGIETSHGRRRNRRPTSFRPKLTLQAHPWRRSWGRSRVAA